ncbi:Elongator subunit elp6 [Podochytrium sp. JEL0797]|nr:Elongator subunit elp6 [Podochytrium sp. JEL0797]
MSLASLAANLPPLRPPTSPSSPSPSSHHVLLTDEIRTPAFPVLHHFLHQALSTPNSTTLLVSFSNTQQHCESVARKLGYTLKSSVKSKFAFIDGLAVSPSGWSRESMSQLLGTIQKSFESLSAGGPCTLVVDQLSFLLSVGVEIKDVVAFFLECRRWVDSIHGNLIVSTHADIALPDFEYLVQCMAESVDYEIHVRGFDGGYTDRATGQVPYPASLLSASFYSISN